LKDLIQAKGKKEDVCPFRLKKYNRFYSAEDYNNFSEF
jgi:hypothetical protein